MMGLSLIWLGHASFQIKADGKNIYIDPYKGVYEEKADIGRVVSHLNRISALPKYPLRVIYCFALTVYGDRSLKM